MLKRYTHYSFNAVTGINPLKPTVAIWVQL